MFFIFPFIFHLTVPSSCLQQVTELPFFATKVRLGRGGAEEIYQLGPLNEYERYYRTVHQTITYLIYLLEAISN